jgi:DUF971 family protein
VDVVKGVRMFGDLKVPVSALVENMAHFDGDDGKRYYPFGRFASSKDLVQECGLGPDSTFTLPIVPDLSFSGDAGRPLSAGDALEASAAASSPLAAAAAADKHGFSAAFAGAQDAFDSLSMHIVRETTKMRSSQQHLGGKSFVPTVQYVPSRGVVLRFLHAESAQEFVVSPKELRMASKDALSIDAHGTGKRTLKEEDVPDDITPLRIEARGNYGVSVDWSDGHDKAIYTFDDIIALAEVKQLQEGQGQPQA